MRKVINYLTEETKIIHHRQVGRFAGFC